MLGTWTFTLPAWLRVACVAVPFLCGREWCDCTTCVRCGCTTCVRCGYTSGYTSRYTTRVRYEVTRLVCDVWETKTPVVGSGRAQVLKLYRVPHLKPRNAGNSGHRTATLSYLKPQFDQYIASKTSSQAMSDFYPM